MVLPPLMEWVRVSSAFAEHRMASYVDSDDTLQAGRIVRYDLSKTPYIRKIIVELGIVDM